MREIRVRRCVCVSISLLEPKNTRENKEKVNSIRTRHRSWIV